jgi:hypothetical protein
MQALFYYKISKEANLAYDTETGEPAECYMQFSMKDDNDNIVDVSEDFYHKKHASAIRQLAKLGEFKEEWFEPITIEQYEKNMEESED